MAKCEYEDCAEEAVGWIDAQWNIFDFLRYHLCFEHLWEARERLSEQELGDFGTPYIIVQFYEPEDSTILTYPPTYGTIGGNEGPQGTAE